MKAVAAIGSLFRVFNDVRSVIHFLGYCRSSSKTLMFLNGFHPDQIAYFQLGKISGGPVVVAGLCELSFAQKGLFFLLIWYLWL